jgi:hypothetical protein
VTTDWVITFTFDADLPMETLDKWEAKLEGFDASVARVPSRGVDVTVYAPGDLGLFDALSKMQGEVLHVVDAWQPIAVEIVSETEHQRRAEAYTMPELMSAAEIADELGISRQRVHQLRSTAGFPEPLADLRGGAVWDAAAVRKFAQTWERRPGRPRVIAPQGIPSAEKFGRPTVTLIDPVSRKEGDVSWRIENPTKNRFVLRNIGNDIAENVEVDVTRIDAITRDLPSGASVQPGEGLDMLLIAAWGHPVPNQLYVRWAGHPEWQAVPLISSF